MRTAFLLRRPSVPAVFLTSAAVLLIIIVGAACGPSVPENPADVVLTGGNIVTMANGAPAAQAIAVRGDRIAAVGSDAEVEALVGPETQVIRLDGKTVVPGMIDAHVHFTNLGRQRQILNARGMSKEEIVAEVGRRAAASPPGDWIEGRGWDQNTW